MRRSRQRSAERGQGIVEFAVIFPFFILFIFIAIDGGVLMGRYNEVNHAAKEGARYAASGATDAEVRMRVIRQSQGLLDDTAGDCGSGVPEICIEHSDPSGSQSGQVGTQVRVSVSYDYGFRTPIANGSFLSLTLVGVPDHFDIDSCAISVLERPVDPSEIRVVDGQLECL